MKKILILGAVVAITVVLAGCQTNKTVGGMADDVDIATLNEDAITSSIETPPMPPNVVQP